MECPNCRSLLSPQARFCNQCGAHLDEPARISDERKKVTIVFSDISGFTAMSERRANSSSAPGNGRRAS